MRIYVCINENKRGERFTAKAMREDGFVLGMGVGYSPREAVRVLRAVLRERRAKKAYPAPSLARARSRAASILGGFHISDVIGGTIVRGQSGDQVAFVDGIRGSVQDLARYVSRYEADRSVRASLYAARAFNGDIEI